MSCQGSGLERLLAAAGVMASYEDARGTTQTVEPEALRGVLAALGFDAPTEAAAAAAATDCEASLLREILEPVYVCLEEGAVPSEATVAQRSISLVHSVAQRDESVRWELTTEDGTVRGGALRLAELPLLACERAAGVDYERRAFALPPPLERGYHRLTLQGATLAAGTTLIVAPAACYLPAALERRGVWGLAVQLYSLRSRRNWGIGDFTDLRELCAIVRAAGGSAVGLNPLHAVRFGTGGVPSPYSPSSRIFNNWMYLDIEALPGFEPRDVDTAQRATARASEYVDYAAIATLKQSVARAAYTRFAATPAAPERAAFEAFVRRGGAALQRAATFEALAARFADEANGGLDWAAWPTALRDPSSAEVAAFARERAAEVQFFAFLQWQVDEQLGRCAREAQLPIGLYLDLAVGADLGGSDTWALQDTLTRRLAVGAPPDLLNVRGQHWGVAPFHPLALRAAAYEPFIALLRANMHHAGALRIDHVMALARLWLMPAGASPTDGAYVAYRLDELLAVIALESARARCMVIGEDLGTVPAGFRERLARSAILSYRLLQFEIGDDGFVAPEAYPALALVATGTHDLPTVGAYWTETDVTLRARLSLFADEAGEARERRERALNRHRLLAAFDAALGCDDARTARFQAASNTPHDRETLAEIALAANRFLAKTPARLLMVGLEDVLGDVTQTNVPTTLDEHPNWRRRASLELETLPHDPRFKALADALRGERDFLPETAGADVPAK